MSPPTCAHCNASSPTLQRCSNCKRVSYCDKACQKADWKSHKMLCKLEPKAGQIIDFAIPVSDPSKPRQYPTFDETAGDGALTSLLRDCYTMRRRADGSMIAIVSEDKWQEHQAREAERKAAEAAEREAMYEESVEDEGDDNGKNE